MSTSRVFATSDHHRIDVAGQAAEWSRNLIQVLPAGQIGTHLLKTEDAVARASQVLEDFNAEEDLLLLIGDPVKIALCAALIASKSPRFTVLRYDRLGDRYYPVELDLSIT